MSNAAILYRYYLAADLALKRLESIGLTAKNLTFDREPYFKNSDSTNVNGVPYRMIYGDVRMSVQDFDYGETPEGVDYEKHQQTVREAKLLEFAARFSDSVVIRDGGQASVFFDGMSDVTVTIGFGQALCEQVVVGYRKVRKPADPEQAAKIMDAIEQVEVEEPILEWRCNDAELMAGAI